MSSAVDRPIEENVAWALKASNPSLKLVVIEVEEMMTIVRGHRPYREGAAP